MPDINEISDQMNADRAAGVEYPTPNAVQVSQNPPTMLDYKLDRLRAAKQEKIDGLNKFRAHMASLGDMVDKQKAAEKASLIGRMNLDPDSTLGTAVNAVAGFATGVSRDLIGKTAALPYTAESAAADASLSAEDTAAYNNYVAGKATPIDMLRLNSKRNLAGNGITGFAAAKASMEANPGPTVLELAQHANSVRAVARKINDVTDISSIEHSGTKDQLTKQLDSGFAEGMQKIHNGDTVSGIASLLLNAGDAAVSNPRGVAQFVFENTPQLLVGALGAAGKLEMTASNIGYAADYYQQGMEDFAKKNGGKLPSPVERTKIAGLAASLAVAEELGDHVGLGAMKLGEKAAKVAGRTGEDAAKTGMLAGLKNTFKAGVEGTLGETATEGYQGYAEDVTSGKRAYNDFSDEALGNIYQNAAIGGMSGGVMSGGVHGLHTMAGATPEQVEARQKDAATAVTFKDAVEAKNPEVFLDPEQKSYNPALAMGVLFKLNQDPAIAPIDRIQNVEKAQGIIDKLDERGAELQQTIKTGSKDEAKAAKAELKTLGYHMDDAAKLMDRITEEHIKATSPQSVDELVQKANVPAQEANQADLDSVINLSMASSSKLTSEHADTLASNTDNGLTDDQRKYLRVFSQARQQENQLSTMGKVSNEVLNGEDKVGGNVGIAQYRSRIGTALQTGNQTRAEQQLGMLGDFLTSHTGKAAAAAQAWSQGPGTQIAKVGKEWQVFPKGTLSAAKLTENGGMPINSEKLVKGIAFEAKALATAHKEMSQAITMRFASSGVAAQQADRVQSITPTPAPSATQLATPGSPSTIEANTAPSGKTLPKQSGKEKTHLDTKDPESVENKPQTETKKAVDKHVGKTEKTVPAALEYLRANKIEKTHTYKNTNRDEYTIVLKTQDKGNFKDQQARKEAQEAKIAESARNLEERKAAKQAEAEQQAKAPAESAVAEASPAVEETQAKEDPLDLASKRTPEGEDRPYQKRNLIADFFKQAPGGLDGTQRPLAVTKDFLSKVFANPKSIFDFIKLTQAELKNDSPQNVALTTFFKLAKDWNKVITSGLTKIKDPDYRYKDVAQFLQDDKGDLPENVKTAISYAAFSYVAENSTRSMYNTDEEINAILGNDEDDIPSPEAKVELGLVGIRQSVVINDLGERVFQALGLKTQGDVPVNLQSQLESGLGAYAMHLLLAQGVIVRNEVAGAVIKRLTGKKATKETARFNFLALARTNGELSKAGQEIADSVKKSGGIVDKLFAVEPGAKEPSLTPVPFTQKTTRNTDQAVPEVLAKMVEKENAAEHKLNTDMWNIVGQMSEEQALAMGGVESTEGAHIFRKFGLQAKNDGLKREYTRMMDYFSTLAEGASMYFEHSVWKQQRVGIATNVINPQSSKIHRHMVYRPSWESTVSVNDTENFLLRVAEGMGVKTDKNDKATALAEINAKLGDEAVRPAVEALIKVVNKKTLTADDTRAIVNGVAFGGENFHSLASLLAVARYEDALAKGEDTFTTQLMGEVDGVTNGPMLSHALMGAAATVGQLFDVLNKGGFFQLGSSDTQYNIWRSMPGRRDLYETTTGHMVDKVNDLAKTGVVSKWGKQILSPARVKQMLPALYAFTGTLMENDKVQKAGRDIIKTPLTSMIFGASVFTAVGNMADRFVEAVYGKIEKLNAMEETTPKQIADKEAARLALLDNLQILGLSVNKSATIKQLMDNQLSPDNLAALQKSFKDVIGTAVQQTMDADFKDFLEQRTTFNKTAQAAFEIYNAAASAVREAYVTELVASGKIKSYVAKNGKITALHDLTVSQEKELNKRLAGLKPVMQTAFSNESKQPDSGMIAAKANRKLSDDPTYENEVHFGTGLGGTTEKSVVTHGRTRSAANPGVGMMVLGTHSDDSFMSHHAGAKVSSLNIHDARGAGVNQLKDVANALNGAAWKGLLEYSPASEIHTTLMNTLAGLNAVLERSGPELQAQIISNVKASLDKLAGEEGTTLEQMVDDAKTMAYRADDMKLQALAQMGHIDQYALEGGNYEVTDKDRAAATAARAKLTPDLSKSEQATLAAVTKVLAQTTPAAPVQAKEGKADVKSDPALVSFFKAGELRSIADVAKQLGTMKLTGFESKLLASLVKVLGARANAYTVRYVTQATTADQILEQPTVPSHAWFVSKAGKNEIYVLGDEFKDSGLTKETLLHEMVHAAVARAIETATGPAAALVAELEELRAKATAFIQQRGLTGFDAATSSVQELVAWGMTNQSFQTVLDGFSMQTKNEGNSLITGLKSFIDTLVGLVFGKKSDAASSGMNVLITNVSGLFKASSQQREQSTTTINQSMATGIQDLTTHEVFDAVAALGNNQVSTAFGTQLRSVLDGIVDTIHGPYGAFKAQITPTITTALDAWANAKQGAAPFAAEVLASGFAFTEQEAFVAEQVEATMRAVLASKDQSTTAAYRELIKLFDDAKDKLTAADFHVDPVIGARLRDFVFGVKMGTDGKSNYLARFAALGLANEQFNTLLQFHTPIKDETLAGLTISEKLHALFDRLLAYIHGKLTHTFEGQVAGEKLNSLVQTLVDIEAKQKIKLANSPLVMVDMFEGAFRNVAEKAREGAAAIGQSAAFKNSQNTFVKLTGAIVTHAAQGRMGEWADALQTYRDQALKQKNGTLMGLVGEVRGVTESNAMFAKLHRFTKYLEGQRKDLMTNTKQFVMESFKDGGKYLSQEAKGAVSAVLLRTDVASLLEDFGMAGIEKLANDRTLVQKQIKLLEAKLARFGANANPYIGLSKALAYKLATGRITNRAILMNAENIARLHGMPQAGKVSAQDVTAATPIIDQLVSLYALDHFHAEHKATRSDKTSKLGHVRAVLKEEASRSDGNGVEFVLRQHKFLQDDAKARLFNTGGTLAMKGYLPEVYNPYIKLVVAESGTEGVSLKEQGYSESAFAVEMDKADPDAHSNNRIYTIRDGGMVRYLSGIISNKGQRSKGSKLHNGDQSLFSVNGLNNMQKMTDVQRSQAYKDDIAVLMGGQFDPTKVQGSRMAPVLNSEGKVVNYRYMMEEQTKDAMLERNNRFDELLGTMAGNTFDKETSAAQNRTTVQALHDQYQAEFATKAGNYTRVGPQSADPEMREVWAMLPESTKQAIREIWGSNNMMVRYDLLDMTFGYRKLSMTDPFGVPPSERNLAEKLYVEMLEHVLGKKATLRVRQFEDIWQALVREAKDTMVVKSGLTLMGNFTSNITELIWFGVPMTDIVKHHRVALKGVLAHRKDSAELARLQMQLETGYLQGKDRKELESRVNQLQDSMARNPVKELIDAGLMPTIVEDVASEEDEYSFKGQMTRKVDEVLSHVNPMVLKTGKFLAMAHDTPIYQMLSYGTQVSDFVARYTLYQHTITRAKNKLDAETAVQLVSDAFVNYDIPSHRNVQYANDMGLVYFSKYYLRIQKVIALLYKQNPGRALMLLTAGHFLDFIPMLQNSGALHRFGNPFSTGAFESLQSLDEMATVNALLYPFR